MVYFLVINDPAKMYEPADFTMVGIGAKQSMAKENFEKNIKNEINFIIEKDKIIINEKKELERNDSKELDEIKDEYLEYGKQYYLKTWKERFQILEFEKQMKERFGDEIDKYIMNIYRQVEKNTNPIEFINCNTKRFNDDNIENLDNEIGRIEEYLKDIEKVELFTDTDTSMNLIPEEKLDKLHYWEKYFIDQIKDDGLKELLKYLAINRPGKWDLKLGEHYQVDFNWVTEFIKTELNNYLEKLNNKKNNIGSIKLARLKTKEEKIIDQDSMIEKFQKECIKRNLQKEKTIPSEVLYEIAIAIGFKVPNVEDFKAGEKYYQEAREYASRLGYKRKRRMEP